MAKSTSYQQSQGAFSFFDDVEKIEDATPKPKKHTLRPPQQILADEKPESDLIQNEENNTNNGNELEQFFVEENVLEASSTDVDSIDDTEQKTFTDSDKGRLESNNEDSTVSFEENTSITTAESDALEIVDEHDNEQQAYDATDERKSTRGRRSVKENAAAASLIEMPEDDILFSKQYYSMGEVTAMFKENHSLIRYWETEFDILKPKKNGKGDRFFRPTDVKNLYLIYDLLRRRKFTIEGAKEYLKNNKKAQEKFAALQSLEKIKGFFLELKANL